MTRDANDAKSMSFLSDGKQAITMGTAPFHCRVPFCGAELPFLGYCSTEINTVLAAMFGSICVICGFVSGIFVLGFVFGAYSGSLVWRVAITMLGATIASMLFLLYSKKTVCVRVAANGGLVARVKSSGWTQWRDLTDPVVLCHQITISPLGTGGQQIPSGIDVRAEAIVLWTSEGSRFLAIDRSVQSIFQQVPMLATIVNHDTDGVVQYGCEIRIPFDSSKWFGASEKKLPLPKR